jgi:hypothetical protein
MIKIDKKDHKKMVLWAASCAEHVLGYFEIKYPKDKRPRKAIESARAWSRDEIAVGEVRKSAFAAHAAACAAKDPSAKAAARAAGQAAATVHVANHAPHAAKYAVNVAKAAGNMKESEWQCKCLLKIKKKLKYV